MGLAQPSVDYNVDSNPEGWTERLWVKGLHGGSGLWPGGFAIGGAVASIFTLSFCIDCSVEIS